ncbi:hypothetical protein DMH18_36155 [Streptomyces sp. WAC 06783]|uniref:hypothetical protein n=1 Tax=Streptomyces sp. WAC 06783 TaxID=2203211 RepID=UPI000F7457C5|nr:hypothetical protein [Streptomyces sp. WAC 06783]RSO03820.1 hypothetical protein DMH18_36155 [Streptomyces sp. WAC 06783]
MAVDITPEIQYYMVITDGTGRGISREPYMNWDFCLLANNTGDKGYPVIFHTKGTGYTIEITSSNWGGYRYLQRVTTGVKLVQEGDAHVWVAQSHTKGASFTTSGASMVYNTSGKAWLYAEESILPNFGRDFAFWTLDKV